MKLKNSLLLGLTILVILVIIVFLTFFSQSKPNRVTDRELITRTGVCPPFYLYDEENNPIDPVRGMNAGKPYSPR